MPARIAPRDGQPSAPRAVMKPPKKGAGGRPGAICTPIESRGRPPRSARRRAPPCLRRATSGCTRRSPRPSAVRRPAPHEPRRGPARASRASHRLGVPPPKKNALDTPAVKRVERAVPRAPEGPHLPRKPAWSDRPDVAHESRSKDTWRGTHGEVHIDGPRARRAQGRGRGAKIGPNIGRKPAAVVAGLPSQCYVFFLPGVARNPQGMPPGPKQLIERVRAYQPNGRFPT